MIVVLAVHYGDFISVKHSAPAVSTLHTLIHKQE